MFLLPLAFIVALALTVWFVLFSEARMRLKIAVAILYLGAQLLNHTRFATAGFFLQIAISLFILLYWQARAR